MISYTAAAACHARDVDLVYQAPRQPEPYSKVGFPLMRALPTSLLVLVFGLGPSLAGATEQPLQDLPTFLQAASRFHPANREAHAQVAQRRANIASAVGTLLPSIALQGGYTRNEYEVAIAFPPIIPHAVISPHNQYDGSAVLSVPLFDLASIFTLTAADSGLGATRAQAKHTGLQIEAQVVQRYYQLLANLALEKASARALEVAEAGEKLTDARLAGGRASQLELDRARAEVEAQRQQVAAAKLQKLLSMRALASATGIAPPDDAVPPDLAAIVAELPPPPETQRDFFIENVPGVLAASLQTKTLAKQAWSSRLSLVPQLAGSFTERFTNAPGFIPKKYYWAAGLTLKWHLNVSVVADMRAADAQLAISRAQEQQARLSAQDAIYQAQETILAAQVRAASAQSQAEVSQKAREVAEERYEAGSLTQLDLLGAQRDAFAAQVAFIQADADLINAHAQRRLAGGESLIASAPKR